MTILDIDPRLLSKVLRSGQRLRSRLPVVEIDKARLDRPGARLRLRRGSKARASSDCSYGGFSDAIEFTALEFCHAAKKTELAMSFSAADADRKAAALLMDHADSFRWGTRNFRKQDSSIFAEFANSSLAGRVGEAISYLVMKKWGYAYWDRCSVVWERAAKDSQIDHREMLRQARVIKRRTRSKRPDLEPDFIFEKPNRDVALMEAKGSFVSRAADNPSVASDLRKARAQLKAWENVISPQPSVSFGIGTYLRDESDSSDDPSLIAFFDPPAEDGASLETPARSPDLIRRCNYGAWLTGMGLVGAGAALRAGEGYEPIRRPLPISQIGGRKYAFTTFPVGYYQYIDDAIVRARWPGIIGYWDEIAIGIDVRVLKVIEIALSKPDSSALLDLPTDESGGAIDEAPVSVFPDGSLFGRVDRHSIEVMDFKL